MKPQNQNIKSIAPVEIVKNYEVFLKAIQSGDFLVARESINTMKAYQGGEKLAQELWDEFFPMLQSDLEKAEKEQEEIIQIEGNEKGLRAERELLAQKILMHADSFQTFLEDKSYDLAQEELVTIKNLGDKNLAIYLENKLLEAKRSELKKKEKEEEVMKLQVFRIAENEKIQKSKVLKEGILALLPKGLSQAKKKFKASEKKLVKNHAQEVWAYIERQDREEWENKRKYWEDVFYLALHEERIKDAESAARRLSLLKVKSSAFWSLIKDLKRTIEKRESVKVYEKFYNYLEGGKISSAKSFLAKLGHFKKDEKELMQNAIEIKEKEVKEERELEKREVKDMKEREHQKEIQKKLQKVKVLFSLAIDDEDETKAQGIILSLKKEGVGVSEYENRLAKMLEGQKKKEEKERLQEKKKKISEFHSSVKSARFRYAKNLLLKISLSDDERVHLEEILSKEEVLQKEAKRKSRVSSLFIELQKLLDEKDFKLAKNTLTKLKKTAHGKEYSHGKNLYEYAFKDEQKGLEVSLYNAILKNIEGENIVMAQSNLKDFQKIGAFEKYHDLKKRISVKKAELKWKENFIGHEDIEKKQEILGIVDEATRLLKGNKFDKCNDLLKKLEEFGDSGLVVYWKKYFYELKELKAKEKGALDLDSQRSSWFAKFQKMLSSEDLEGVSCAHQLLLEASDFYSLIEVQAFKKQLQERLEYLEIQKLVIQRKFLDAHEYIQNFSGDIWKKDEYLFLVNKAESEYEEALLKEELQRMKVEIQKKKEGGDFQSALELSEKLLGLEKSSDYLKIKKEIEIEQKEQEEKKRSHEVALIIKDIEKGNFQSYEKKKHTLRSKDLIQVEKASSCYSEEQSEKERKEKFLELFHRLKEEKNLSQQEDVFQEIKRVAVGDEYHQAHNAFEELQLKERRIEVQKLLEKSEYQLHELCFHELRETAKSLLDIGALKESEDLIVRCLKREAMFQKELFMKDIPALYGHINKTFKSHDFQKIQELIDLVSEQSLLLKTAEGEKIFHLMAGLIEKEIEKLIQIEAFSQAETLLLLLKQFPSKSFVKLGKVISKQRAVALKKQVMQGTQSLKKKKEILFYYQSWKNSYENNLSSHSYTEGIKKLSEKTFSYFLMNYNEYLIREKNGYKETENEKSCSKVVSDSLRSSSCSFLKASLLKTFYNVIDFSQLKAISFHYSHLLKVKKEEQFTQGGERVEQEIKKMLREERVDEAHQLLSESLFKSISLTRALGLADTILLREERIQSLQNQSQRKSFMFHLSNADVKEAEQYISNLSPSEVLEAIKTLQSDNVSCDNQIEHKEMMALKKVME
ncbi:hypothetical protein HON22_04955, partial [Candidatus Peregrinibacteria bacterium]|nr:hypothetical protein [Candidatus Peregrinibacteria bacterium]